MGAYEWTVLAIAIATLVVNTVSAVAAILTLWGMVRRSKGRHTKGR